MKICNRCSAVADSVIARECPKCGGATVGVEDLFCSAVMKLNKKGYYVTSAVPGAVGQHNMPAVIIFDKCVDSFPAYTKDILTNYNITASGAKGNRYIKLTREFDEKDAPQEILRNSIITSLWSVKLPGVGTDKYFYEPKICYINNMEEDLERPLETSRMKNQIINEGFL